MEVFEQSLRAFCRTAMQGNKFVDEEGNPAERSVRLHAGHTAKASRRFADQIVVEIDGDHDDLAELLIDRAAERRSTQNCYVMLYRKGDSNYKDHASLPQTHADTEHAGQGFLTIPGKNGPIAVMDRDPIAQLTNATAVAVGVSLRAIENTNTALLMDQEQVRLENKRLTQENAKLQAVVFILERYAPNDTEDPTMKMLQASLKELKDPMMEGMALLSVVAQQWQGVPNPGTAKERARRGKPDPAPAPDKKTSEGATGTKTETDANTDDDVIDVEPDQVLSDDEYGVELDKQMGYAIDMCSARPHMVTPLRVAKLIPVLALSGVKPSTFCEVCNAPKPKAKPKAKK